MTVTLTTCTTFNTGFQVINSHSVLKHLTLPLGRNNGMARFANKSNSNFPFQECVVSKGQATSTADHFIEYRFYYKCWCAGLRPPTICAKGFLAYNA